MKQIQLFLAGHSKNDIWFDFERLCMIVENILQSKIILPNILRKEMEEFKKNFFPKGVENIVIGRPCGKLYCQTIKEWRLQKDTSKRILSGKHYQHESQQYGLLLCFELNHIERSLILLVEYFKEIFRIIQKVSFFISPSVQAL